MWLESDGEGRVVPAHVHMLVLIVGEVPVRGLDPACGGGDHEAELALAGPPVNSHILYTFAADQYSGFTTGVVVVFDDNTSIRVSEGVSDKAHGDS